MDGRTLTWRLRSFHITLMFNSICCRCQSVRAPLQLAATRGSNHTQRQKDHSPARAKVARSLTAKGRLGRKDSDSRWMHHQIWGRKQQADLYEVQSRCMPSKRQAGKALHAWIPRLLEGRMSQKQSIPGMLPCWEFLTYGYSRQSHRPFKLFCGVFLGLSRALLRSKASWFQCVGSGP